MLRDRVPIPSYARINVMQLSHFSVYALYVHHLTFPPTLKSWKYTRSLCLWPVIQIMKDWITSTTYTMCASSSSCLSHSWLDFSSGFNIVKVHKVTVFMTKYSNAERPSCVSKLQNVRIFQFVPFRFNMRFFFRVKYYASTHCHFVYVLIVQYWKTEFHQHATLCSHLPGHAPHADDSIFSSGLISWKYTMSLCLWVKKYSSAERPSYVSKLHNVRIFQFVPFTLIIRFSCGV